MKQLSIIAFNAYTTESGVEKFAVRTNAGIVYFTKDYLAKKAKSIGKTINDILSNGSQYVINAEEVVERKEGVEFTYTDKDGVEQTVTPKSDYLDTESISLSLNQSGSLNQMIASSVADRIADSLAGAFGGLGLPSTNQNPVSSDTEEEDEEIVIDDESTADKN